MTIETDVTNDNNGRRTRVAITADDKNGTRNIVPVKNR